MAERQDEATDVSEEELEQQDGSPLPDREAMSLITPGPDPIPLPLPVEEPAEWTNPSGHR